MAPLKPTSNANGPRPYAGGAAAPRRRSHDGYVALSFERDRREDHLSLAASLWLAALAVGVLVFWGRWRDVLLPTRNLVRFGLLASGAFTGVVGLCYRPTRRPWWRNASFAIAVGLAVVGVGMLPSRVELDVREHETELVAIAERIAASPPSSTDGCEPAPPGLTVGDLGPFDQLCNAGGGVEFRQNVTSSRTEGLVYLNPGARGPQSSCVKELFGRWLQFVRPADPNCPFGFEFIGGG